ncbi:prephenate dehydrogenase/arogenate dehydrogenase family protein [Candidatus Saccharibacteria bacterium]|nr:prephenate dehydrogenase/arogenate dehydrogenase family protein [Candidatus Saccharibacteria bacterium]
MTKLKIGIIGYGDFTKVLITMLAPYADIVVSSRQNRVDAAGVRFVKLEEALAQPIIIPSFPSQYFKAFFSQYGVMVNSKALVIDVCSVKVNPLAVLEKYLPASCSIVGTHPMFGPASIQKNGGVRDLKCAYVPTRIAAESESLVRNFISHTLGLKIIETTPAEHDKSMAYVQGLSHYIGRVMDEMAIPDTPLATMAYEDLLDMKRIQGSDSWDLFMSIVHENPYASQVRNEFSRACHSLNTKIEQK